MSEETTKGTEGTSTPTITAPTTTRVKDPRRVAQGKKLAEISKAAKAAKKKRLLEEAEKAPAHEGGGDYVNYSTIFGAIGVVVGIGGLYFSYKGSILKWKQKTVVNESVVEESVTESSEVVEPKEKLVELEGFD